MRIPRKLKKKIPKGVYCYTFLKMKEDSFGYYIRSCPFYNYVKAPYGYCKLTKEEVDDQCKNCNINKI